MKISPPYFSKVLNRKILSIYESENESNLILILKQTYSSVSPILLFFTLHSVLKLSTVNILYLVQFSTMSTSTSTSTPLTLFNSSVSPTILSQEMNETSFYSAVPTIPELPQNDKKMCI